MLTYADVCIRSVMNGVGVRWKAILLLSLSSQASPEMMRSAKLLWSLYLYIFVLMLLLMCVRMLLYICVLILLCVCRAESMLSAKLLWCVY